MSQYFASQKRACCDNLINGVFIQIRITMNSVDPRTHTVTIVPFARNIT